MNSKRKCSICKRKIPYNSGYFIWNPKTNEYICGECAKEGKQWGNH